MYFVYNFIVVYVYVIFKLLKFVINLSGEDRIIIEVRGLRGSL